jgi:hypothetical protein
VTSPAPGASTARPSAGDGLRVTAAGRHVQCRHDGPALRNRTPRSQGDLAGVAGASAGDGRRTASKLAFESPATRITDPAAAPWNTPASHPALTAVQADLPLPRGGHVEGRLRPQPRAQALQQPLRHVLQAAEPLHGRALALLLRQLQQQAPLLHQLQDQRSDLQQKGIGRPLRPVAVGVLQVQAAVLRNVKPLVLEVPTMPPSFRRDLHHRLVTHVQVRDPGPRARCTVFKDFLTIDCLEDPRTPPAVRVRQVGDPAVHLPHPRGRLQLHAPVRLQRQQRLEFLPQGRQTPRLEGVHERAAEVLGDLKPLAAAVQPVAAQAQRQLRELGPHPGRQPPQRPPGSRCDEKPIPQSCRDSLPGPALKNAARNACWEHPGRVC